MTKLNLKEHSDRINLLKKAGYFIDEKELNKRSKAKYQYEKKYGKIGL